MVPEPQPDSQKTAFATVEDAVAEGDRVVVRWSQVGTHSGNFMGIPPTGKEFTIAGIDIHAVRDGRNPRGTLPFSPATTGSHTAPATISHTILFTLSSFGA